MEDSCIFETLNVEQQKYSRATMIECILQTDMAKHFPMIETLKKIS